MASIGNDAGDIDDELLEVEGEVRRYLREIPLPAHISASSIIDKLSDAKQLLAKLAHCCGNDHSRLLAHQHTVEMLEQQATDAGIICPGNPEHTLDSVEEELLEAEGRIRGLLRHLQKGEAPDVLALIGSIQDLLQSAEATKEEYKQFVHNSEDASQLLPQLSAHERTLAVFASTLAEVEEEDALPPPPPNPPGRRPSTHTTTSSTPSPPLPPPPPPPPPAATFADDDDSSSDSLGIPTPPQAPSSVGSSAPPTPPNERADGLTDETSHIEPSTMNWPSSSSDDRSMDLHLYTSVSQIPDTGTGQTSFSVEQCFPAAIKGLPQQHRIPVSHGHQHSETLQNSRSPVTDDTTKPAGYYQQSPPADTTIPDRDPRMRLDFKEPTSNTALISNSSVESTELSDSSGGENILGKVGHLPLIQGYVNVVVHGYVVQVSAALKFLNVSSLPTADCIFAHDVEFSHVLCDIDIVYHDGTTMEYSTVNKEQPTVSSPPVSNSSPATQRKWKAFSDSDELKLDIGTIHPGEYVQIRFTYETQITTDAENTNLLKVRVPKSIFPPHFSKQHATPTDVLQSVISVHITMPFKLTLTHSSSHPIHITEGTPKGNVSQVMVKGSEADPLLPLKSDFLLLLEGDLSKKNLLEDVIVEKDPFTEDNRTTYCLMVPLCPPVSHAHTLYDPNVEVVFAVQYTTSTPRDTLKSISYALQLFIQSLPNLCRFNVIVFGHTFKSMFSGPQVYTPAAVKKAFQWLGNIQPLNTGTSIWLTLKHCFEEPPTHCTRHIYVLLTDQIEAPLQQICQLAHSEHRATRGQTCVHTVCVENGDAIFGSALANSGGGMCEVAETVGEMQDIVCSHMQKHLLASITQCEVSISVPAVLSVDYLNPIYYGSRAVVFAFMSESDWNTAVQPAVQAELGYSPTVAVKYRDHSSRRSVFEAHLASVNVVEGRALHTMAACQKIKSIQVSDHLTPEQVQDVQRYSQLYHVFSHYTTLSCTCAAPRAGCPERIEVTLPSVSARPFMLMAEWPSSKKQGKKGHAQSSGTIVTKIKKLDWFREVDTRKALLVTREHNSLSITECFVYMQHPDGYWKLDDDILHLLPCDKGYILSSAPTMKADVTAREAWVTALSVAFLRTKFANSHVVWGNVHLKALRWLHKHDKLEWLQKAFDALSPPNPGMPTYQ